MILERFSLLEMLAMIGAFIVSGLMRGFNGGAGANFITAPVLAAIVGPRETVPLVLGLNLFSSLQLIPGAVGLVNWREAVPLGVAAAATIPLGAWILFAVDEDIMRRAVAGTAIAFSVLMLSGWRYRGPRGVGAAVTVGVCAGTVSGAVTIGGPPVFLYLLSGQGGRATNRATFIAFGFMLQLIAVIVFVVNGVVTQNTLWLAAVLFIPFVIAVRFGVALFKIADEEVFRRVSLIFMVVIATGILIF